MNENWELYKELVEVLVVELPVEAVPLGEFIIKWSPFIFLLILASKLIDQLFKSASIKFFAFGFVKCCKLVWSEAFKEPTHTGIIIEAPISVQRAFHKIFAWVQGIQVVVLFLYFFFAFYPLVTMQIKDGKFIEGIIILSFISCVTIFMAFIQVGMCHQSIKLTKSLQSN